MSMKNTKRLALLVLVLVLVAGFFALGGAKWLTLEGLKSGQAQFAAWQDASPVLLGLALRRGLCAGDRLVAARRSDHDPGCWRDLRPVLGHRDCLVRLHPGRDPGLSGARVTCCATRCSSASATGSRPSTTAWPAMAPSTCLRCAWCRCFRSFSINLLMGLTPMRALHFLLGQPGRHAGRHGGVRQCRHPAGADRQPVRHLSRRRAACPSRCWACSRCSRKAVLRLAAAPPRLCALDDGRSRFDRNLIVIGAGAAGLVTRLYRRRSQGQGHADRGAQDGRRLPELRLRAEQGADQERQARVTDAPCRPLRPVGDRRLSSASAR